MRTCRERKINFINAGRGGHHFMIFHSKTMYFERLLPLVLGATAKSLVNIQIPSLQIWIIIIYVCTGTLFS